MLVYRATRSQIYLDKRTLRVALKYHCEYDSCELAIFYACYDVAQNTRYKSALKETYGNHTL